jgi:opacity protein-like surface antigen
MKSLERLSLVKIMLTVLLLLFISTAYAADQPQMSPAPAASPKAKMAPEAKAKSAKMARTQMTVSGTIVANKNKAGKITGFALKEDDGQDIMLSKHGKGMELRKMVGKKVEAKGTLEESKGKKWITVKEFKEIQ